MNPAIYSRARASALFSPPQRVYVFHGQDDQQKDEAIGLLRDATVDPDFGDFDSEVVEAEAQEAGAILAAAALVPVGGGKRLVVVRGAEVYRRRERQADAEALAAGLKGLGPSGVLVLRVAAPPDEDRRAKTVLTAKLDRAVSEAGVMVECRAFTEDQLVAWLQEEAAAAGKVLEAGGAARLARTGRGDRRALANELEKAVCYAGSGTAISLADVEAVVSYDPEDVMFRVVDAVCDRDADRALTLLHELLRYDGKPQSVAGRLLALLGRQLKLMWQASELAAMGIGAGGVRALPAEVSAQLPTEGSLAGMAWRAREIFGAARRWQRAEIGAAMGALVDCDLANKGGETGNEDVVTNVELLLIRLCQ